MYSSKKQLVQKLSRSFRISLAIVVIGIANTATAGNWLANFLPLFRSENAQAQPWSMFGAQVTRAADDYIVCSTSAVRVRNQSLTGVLFQAQANESVRLFQGWGENSRSANVNGQATPFIRAQFESGSGRVTNIGYIEQNLVKRRSECGQAQVNNEVADTSLSGTGGVGAITSAPVDSADSSYQEVTSGSGLNASTCCRFPIGHRPLETYTPNVPSERNFGAGRAGNRIHAAADLYGNHQEPIFAVTQGQVVRGLYAFYYGTYAIEVQHAGGFVVRYGEVSGRRTNASNAGARVTQGQTIAHMGLLIGQGGRRIRPPMLHFELYTGNLRGPLTSGSNRYNRRADLINPTSHLQRWERRSF